MPRWNRWQVAFPGLIGEDTALSRRFKFGGIMRSFKILPAALVLATIPLAARAQQPPTLSEGIDKIVSQDQLDVQALRQYSTLVETYIQNHDADNVVRPVL